jgi:hypothetical protein
MGLVFPGKPLPAEIESQAARRLADMKPRRKTTRPKVV